MEIETTYSFLAILVKGSFLFGDLDYCLTPFGLACKRGLEKIQFALGNEENTKQSLASELGILILASDPCSQSFSFEISHVRCAIPQLRLTNQRGGNALAFPRLCCTPGFSSAYKSGAFSSFSLSKKEVLLGTM